MVLSLEGRLSRIAAALRPTLMLKRTLSGYALYFLKSTIYAMGNTSPSHPAGKPLRDPFLRSYTATT